VTDRLIKITTALAVVAVTAVAAVSRTSMPMSCCACTGSLGRRPGCLAVAWLVRGATLTDLE
jgi:hypothetical protein